VHGRGGRAADQDGVPQGRAFGAFRHRDFTIFWSGAVISHIAGWMQQVAQSWLVYDLTGSPLLIGVNGLFQSIPFVTVSFYAGTLIDRVDRRKLLIWLELANGLVALAVAILVAGGWIQLWHIFLSGFLHGLIGAFESPARSALLPHLVPRADLMTAVSLQSIQRKGAQIIGPAMGGFFLAGFGVAGSFFIRAASFGVVMASVALVRTTNPVSTRSREAPLRAMLDGIRYVRAEPVIGGLIVMETAISIFGSYSSMMVIFAREVFATGPEGLGLLQSAAGFGSVAGSLILATLGDVRRKGLLLLVAGVGYGLTLLAFSFTPWFALAVPMLALAGGFDIIFGAIRQTIIQYLTREEMLGRVMSLTAISQRGLGTFGGFQAGALTSALGSVQLATAIGAVVSIAVLIGVTSRVPLIRNFTGTSASTARAPQPAPAPV
jgi:MFS family permease